LAHAHRKFQNSVGQPDTNSHAYADADADTNSDTNPDGNTNTDSDPHTYTQLLGVDYAVLRNGTAWWWNRLLYRDNHANRRVQFVGQFIRERPSRWRHGKL
jgi:hypothetical protein